MSPSNELINFNAHYEQLHDGDLNRIGLQPKPDARPNPIWTEGYGHAMVDEKGNFRTLRDYPTMESILPYSQIETEEEAWAMLKWDTEAFAQGVLRRLKVRLNQHQFDALVSHSYNCGYSETLYRLINNCAPEAKIKWWWTNKYITAGGRYLRGLQYRRNDEYEIWLGKNYKREYNLSI